MNSCFVCRVYDSGQNDGYGLDYATDYHSDEYSRLQFQPNSRVIGSAASNSSGTAVMSLPGNGRCGSAGSNFVDIDPSEVEAYAAQLAAAGRRYDSRPEDVLSPVMGSIGSGGAIVETNDAYEDLDM